jgi:hypothetical protein
VASLSKTLREAVARLGPIGTLRLLFRKLQKRQRYALMLREVPKVDTIATLIQAPHRDLAPSDRDRTDILAEAERMLADDNRYFTYPYQLREIDRAWEYDPLEKKYWPRRHYTEQQLHADDTPQDVKIVWEINRFVDLPTLGQAAFIARDERFAAEAEWRILSWIEENPFANSINWASALEIAIRLISWSVTLRILEAAGFVVHNNPRIRRSIYEQLRYLSSDLSTDKVVPTNHLIGEAAGLFIGSSLWDYPTARLDSETARRILEEEIIRQTFEDGVTREASSWYHQFVTGFFDLVDRVSSVAVSPMSAAYRDRLAKMKSYVQALRVNGQLVRFGDADDGLPLKIMDEAWLSAGLGRETTPAADTMEFFTVSRQAAVRVQDSFLFIRGGEFGMGGAGFSSHAHDDLLSPILYLAGLPVLADPGTYVYNGSPGERRAYRGTSAHNVIGETSAAVQRMNFGWHTVRPDATLDLLEHSADRVKLQGSYGEWPWHERHVVLESHRAIVRDRMGIGDGHSKCDFRFHLDPRWKLASQTAIELLFEDHASNHLTVRLRGAEQPLTVQQYDYSPSYRVKQPACGIILTSVLQAMEVEFEFQLIAKSHNITE